MVEIIVTGDFRKWYETLSEDDLDAVNRVVGLLEVKGVALPFPYSSALKGSKKYALRELRTVWRATASNLLCLRSGA